MRLLFWLLPSLVAAQSYDIVLQSGRVIDPESGLDAVRSVGITGNKIAIVSQSPLRGRIEVDVTNLVIAPGFIDLHQHSQTSEDYGFKAMDGVTTALELQVGVSPVSPWYAERRGKSIINFGASSGHIPARMAIMHDTGGLLPARSTFVQKVRTSCRSAITFPHPFLLGSSTLGSVPVLYRA